MFKNILSVIFIFSFIFISFSLSFAQDQSNLIPIGEQVAVELLKNASEQNKLAIDVSAGVLRTSSAGDVELVVLNLVQYVVIKDVDFQGGVLTLTGDRQTFQYRKRPGKKLQIDGAEEPVKFVGKFVPGLLNGLPTATGRLEIVDKLSSKFEVEISFFLQNGNLRGFGRLGGPPQAFTNFYDLQSDQEVSKFR